MAEALFINIVDDRNNNVIIFDGTGVCSTRIIKICGIRSSKSQLSKAASAMCLY